MLLQKRNKKHYTKHKEAARALINARLAHYNSLYNFAFGSVRIKNGKSRWASCSKKGNLNFNYKLLFLPLPLVDYIVVHELCHLKEFNHSPKFWALVAEAVPDYRERRRYLRQLERAGALYQRVLASRAPIATKSIPITRPNMTSDG